MVYAFIENGRVVEYPLYEGDIKLRYPNTSFSSPFVAPSEFAEVSYTPRPSVGFFEFAEEGEPLLVNGHWQMTWVVKELSEDEKLSRIEAAAARARKKRNLLLTQSDWTQLPDSPVATEAWAAYRQELRDIPNQSDFPLNVVWPEDPHGNTPNPTEVVIG